MSKLIFQYSTTATTILVRCSKCNSEFIKVPNTEVYGKEFKFCPMCGCKITCEGYGQNISKIIHI